MESHSINIATSDDEYNDDIENEDMNEEGLSLMDRLGDRVIASIQSYHQDVDIDYAYSITAGQLSQDVPELSVEDANAELCGILQAVGSTARFVFREVEIGVHSSKVNDSSSDESRSGEGYANVSHSALLPSGTAAKHAIMVFQFPSNFERMCHAYRRREEWKEWLVECLIQLYKIFRAVVSFGLILSLAVLAFSVVLALTAATIAMARGGGGNGHGRSGGSGHQHPFTIFGIHRLRSLFYTVRQFLFMYVLMGGTFGNDNDQQQNIFDGLLISSLVCGNPLSPWFWMRANRLQRRRQRARHRGRGWAATGSTSSVRSSTMLSGVTEIRAGTWREQGERPNNGLLSSSMTDTQQSYNSQQFRGLLSIIIEFLFGPDDQISTSNPTSEEKWQLRAAVIQMKLKQNNGFVTLEELLPFVQHPSRINSNGGVDNALDVTPSLTIVAHFSGVPIVLDDLDVVMQRKNAFVFPELAKVFSSNDDAADGSDQESGAASYKRNETGGRRTPTAKMTRTQLPSSPKQPWYHTDPIQSWESIFYELPSSSRIQHSSGILSSSMSGGSELLPRYLIERPKVMTAMSKEHFTWCIGLGFINLVGMEWLKRSLTLDHVTDYSLVRTLARYPLIWFTCQGFVSVLHVYSRLFFLLFVARLCILLPYNYFFITQPNKRRKLVADQLECEKMQSAPSSSSLNLELPRVASI